MLILNKLKLIYIMVGIINKFGEKKKISIKEVKGETKARVRRKWIFLMISKLSQKFLPTFLQCVLRWWHEMKCMPLLHQVCRSFSTLTLMTHPVVVQIHLLFIDLHDVSKVTRCMMNFLKSWIINTSFFSYEKKKKGLFFSSRHRCLIQCTTCTFLT